MKPSHSPQQNGPHQQRLGSRIQLPVAIQSLALALTLVTGSLVLHDNAQAEAGKTLATGSGLPLAANAPDEYTVKRGDTLWDIARTYLNQPWYWPELWYLNPQVQNPHLIYPGDKLKLVTIDGQTRLTLASRGAEAPASGSGNDRVVSGGAVRLSPEVRTEDMGNAVTTISYKDISAFLGRPSVISTEEVKNGPHLLSRNDRHVIGAAGDDFYVVGLPDATRGARYNVLHVVAPLKDPDSGKVLGYSTAYVGNGPITQTGDPAKLRFAETAREALPGDRVYSETYLLNMNFLPHAPTKETTGSVFALAEDATVTGRHSVVAINRGSKDGLESGHVLGIFKPGITVVDRYADGRSADPTKTPNGLFQKKVKLPEERIGTLMVFKTFDNMSYALVMDADKPVQNGDRIGNP